MNFNKIIFKSLLLTGLVAVNACEENLDTEPRTQFSEEVVFSEASRVQQQVNGVYASMKNGQFLGGRFMVYMDVRAEEFLNETNNGITAFQTWNHTLLPSTGEVGNLWNQGYLTINRANVLMDGLVKYGSKLDATQVAQWSAEAKFIRALSYFNLLQLYARPYADGNGSKAGLPLRLKGETGLGENDLARSTVAEVYAQILADLDAAEGNLPDTYSSDLLNTTRAHKNTARALKTRVYLAMGQYNKVVEEADKIVSPTAPFKSPSGVANELVADVTSVFKTPYTTKESIFSLPFTSNDLPGTQNGLGSYYNPGPRGAGDYSLNTSGNGILADPFWKDTDVRKVNWLFSTSETSTKRYLNKFPTSPTTDYAPMVRYAEVLLNLAEARARLFGKDDARAIALLNAVHGRSDNTVTFSPASFATNDDLINTILKERRIELIGEGFRSFDLLRLMQPIPAKSTIGAVQPTSTNYIWPIPVGELNTNKLIEPNL
jgi:starch-binding outer membrane protein, SusD/RagB family